MADSRLVFKIIIVGTLALTSILLSVQGAPTDLQLELAKENCNDTNNPGGEQNNEEYAVIDQRQNGTENYRINVKDVVLIWAPTDALFAATSLLDTQIFGEDFLGTGELSDVEKPQSPQVEVTEPLVQNSTAVEPPANENENGPINPTSKPAHLRSRLRQSSGLLASLLKRKQ